MKKAVIFDMDGVISDSEYINILAKHKLLQSLGIEVDWHYHDQFLGTTYEFMWEKMKEEFHLPEAVSYYVETAEKKRDELILKEGLQPIPGVVELIHRIQRAGIPMAVASSSSKRNIISNLSILGVFRYFQQIVSGEECKKGKPDSEIFLKAASMLKEKPEALKQDLTLADLVVSDFDTLTIEQLMED